jgi:hypothetical protein
MKMSKEGEEENRGKEKRKGGTCDVCGVKPVKLNILMSTFKIPESKIDNYQSILK